MMKASYLLLLLGATLAFSAATIADARGHAQEQRITGRINVTATLVHNVGRRLGPRGRQSNALEQSWRITDSHGRHIGHELLACRWVVSNGRLCQGEITMPLGKITFAGSSPTSFQGEYAVTGGTGVYRGAGGNLLFVAIGLRKNVLLITIER